MPDLANWDDLIHGTLVFGAALPFVVALAAGRLAPSRLWLAAALALVGPFLWLFGLPSPPLTSDDAVVSALGVALISVAIGALVSPRAGAVAAAGLVLWGALAWFLYPAWLASEGGLVRRLLVAGSMAVSISAFGLVLGRSAAGKARLSPAAFLPLAVALAVLLATGGASQFAQCSGAVASTMAALCVVAFWRGNADGISPAAVLWGMLLAFLAWAGWLFAEIRPGAAALLFLSPLASLVARRLPLPRARPIQSMLWDGGVALLAVAPVLVRVLLEYASGSAGDSEGY